MFYGREIAPIVNGLEDITDTLVAHPDRWGQALDGLGQSLNIVMPMLSGNGVVIDQHKQRLAPDRTYACPTS